jgi:ABC-type uncharacterized transport system auxiliary subunit
MKRRSIFAIVPILLARCSVLPKREYQERRDWPLLPARQSPTLAARPRGKILLIRTMSAAPGLEARGLQSLSKDGSVNVDYYEQWAASPAQAMEEALRRWLSESGLFAAVVAPGSRVTPDLVLETELTALVADLPAGAARAGLSLVLLEPKGETSRVRLQRTETAAATLEGTGPAALVAALRQASASVLGQVEASLARAL